MQKVEYSAEYVKAFANVWKEAFRGLYIEGFTLTFLEDSNAPIARSLERAPCDGVLLLDDIVAQLEPEDDKGRKNRLNLTLKCIDDNVEVIPFDIKSATTKIHGITRKARYEVSLGQNQMDNAQFIILEFPICPSVRVIIPPFLFNWIQISRATTWVTAYASPFPPIFACLAVRLEDLTQAMHNIRDCVQDTSKEYVNPTTLARFPAGMFKTVKAQEAMVGYVGRDGDRKQLRFIISAISQYEGMYIDIPGVNFLYDFHIGMGNRIVSFEAKMDHYRVVGNAIKHTVTMPVRGGFRRVLHHDQLFQYFWTQSGFDEAYIIPSSRLPEVWYTSNNAEEIISLSAVRPFRVDLSKADWVQTLVRIVDATWQEVIDQPTGAKPILPRFITKTVDTDDEDIEEDDRGGQKQKDGFPWLHNAIPSVLEDRTETFESDNVYLHLLRLCAHRRSGMIIPFHLAPVDIVTGAICSKPLNSQSYIMFRYRWSAEDAANFECDGRMPPLCSMDHIRPSRRVVPITIMKEIRAIDFALHGRTCFSHKSVSVVAQPFHQIIIFPEDVRAPDTKISVIPSEFIRIEDEIFRFKLKRDGTHVSFALNEVLDENLMNFRHCFKDVTALILKLLDLTEGEEKMTFKRGTAPVKKQSYVHSYGYLNQHLASQIVLAHSGEAMDEET